MKNKQLMYYLRNFSRIFVGLVFIFSGFSKGVDPLGTAYRIEDYFIAYGTQWAIPSALYLSVFLCSLEFVLGVILLLNIRFRLFYWTLFLLMIFFTFLTLYDALYNPVPDCGCFGDAIKLSNWATFYKNLILLLFVTIIFLSRNKFNPYFARPAQYVLTVVMAGLFVGFCIYNYNHLPVIDFRNWKVGNDMVPEDQGEAKIYLKFRNKETGEIKEYLSPEYPWQDSVWMSEWEFVDQRIDDSMVKKSHQLVIEDEEGMDYTETFINNLDYQFLVIAYSLEDTEVDAFTKINELYKKADVDGYSLVVLTSSLPEKVREFRKNVHPELEFFYADDIILKTMIRANPGLMLMKDGIVIDKWHYNDLPDYEEMKSTILEN